MDSKDWSLLAVAKRQQGVITDAQALAVGFNRSAIKWRLKVGEWTRVLPRVARMYWADDTWATRCRAATLWAGPDGALSHLTAASVHGFDVQPEQQLVHVTRRRGDGRLNCSGFKSHRAMHQPKATTVSGLRVTPPARTMVDLAAMVDETELERLLRLALTHGQITPAEMQAELAQLTRGNGGAQQLRRVFNRLVRA